MEPFHKVTNHSILNTIILLFCTKLNFYMKYHIREVPGYDFPCQNPYGRYGFFPGVLHTIFRHGESVYWLSYEPCFVWRFCVIGCRKIFRVQIWYEKHGFSAGSFDFGTNFQNKKAMTANTQVPYSGTFHCSKTTYKKSVAPLRILARKIVLRNLPIVRQ